MVKKIDFEILEKQCMPCAHCGGKATVAHQDYIGDSYVGDQFAIGCNKCNIDTSYEEWKTVLAIWNKRVITV
jgi:hypothetical protein